MIKTLIKLVVVLSVIVLGLFWRNSAALAEAPAPESIIDPLFEKIAYCESKNNLQAKNPNSSASGEFQFLKGTWKHYGQKYWGDAWATKDIFSDDNRELAWFVYTTYGTGDWEADPASYNCWKSTVPLATHRDIF